LRRRERGAPHADHFLLRGARGRKAARAGSTADAPLPRIDARVFLFALFHVPARQAVFNFAVRTGVLFEDGNPNAMIRQNFGGHGAGDRSADHGDEMFPGNRHYWVS